MTPNPIRESVIVIFFKLSGVLLQTGKRCQVKSIRYAVRLAVLTLHGSNDLISIRRSGMDN